MGGIIISKLDNRRKRNSSSTHRLPTFLFKYMEGKCCFSCGNSTRGNGNMQRENDQPKPVA